MRSVLAGCAGTGKSILRKVTLLGGRGEPLKKRILTHGGASPPLFFPTGSKSRQQSPVAAYREAGSKVKVGCLSNTGGVHQRYAQK